MYKHLAIIHREYLQLEAKITCLCVNLNSRIKFDCSLVLELEMGHLMVQQENFNTY